MADPFDILIDQVDDLLNRAACEVVLGAADGAASVRTLLGTDAPERDTLMNQLLTEARTARERVAFPKVSSDV